MTAKNHDQLIETMTLLMLVNTQSRRFGVLSIDLIIDQVKEPLLKKGLQMFVNGRDDRNIRDILERTNRIKSNSSSWFNTYSIIILHWNERNRFIEFDEDILASAG